MSEITTPAPQFDQVAVSGAEVLHVIKAIEPTITQFPAELVYLASLSLATMIMSPGCSPEQLQEAVKGMSEWLSTYFESQDVPTPPEQLN